MEAKQAMLAIFIYALLFQSSKYQHVSLDQGVGPLKEKIHEHEYHYLYEILLIVVLLGFVE